MANSALGDLFVAQRVPELAEAANTGGIYNVQTATLFAPLTAIPTTTAALEIHNNTNNLSFAVIDLFASQILSTAATQTYAIYAQVVTKAAPTLTSLTVFSQSGGGGYASALSTRVITGVGTTVVATGWRPWGEVQAWGTAAATPGNSWSARVDGALIVPPDASLCIHVVGSLATASTFQVGASWLEADFTA